MNKEEYNKLVNERNKLRTSLEMAKLPKHVLMVSEQLKDVRSKIENAHREQYKGQLNKIKS